MLIWGSIIILGSISYMILNDGKVKEKEKEIIEEVKEEINYRDKTFLYFSNLSLSDQKIYMEYNLDLRDYKDILTDNRYFNAKKVANISEKLGKEFTNINKRY